MQEGDRIGRRARALQAHGRRLEPIECEDGAQGGHLHAQDTGDGTGLLDRDQGADGGVLEDACVTAQMLLDLLRSGRWIDGHGDAPGHEDAEETEEIVGSGRQHECDGRALAHTILAQMPGHPRRALGQVAIADRARGLLEALVEDVQALGVTLEVPIEHIQESTRVARMSGVRDRRVTHRHSPALGPRLIADEVEQLARGCGQECLLGETHAETLLDPRDQLRASQAVEAQIGLEPRVQAQSIRQLRQPRLAREALEDRQEPLGSVRIQGGMGHGRVSIVVWIHPEDHDTQARSARRTMPPGAVGGKRMGFEQAAKGQRSKGQRYFDL